MSTRARGLRSGIVLASAGLLVALAALPAAAEAPEILRVQGVVTELQGGPVADGDYVFEAEIYDVAQGGEALFSTTVTAAVAAGAYSLPLEPASPGALKGALAGPGPRFVQITVVEDAAGNPIGETLLPRQQLTSVPYAFDTDSPRVLVASQEVNDAPEVVLPLPSGFDRFEVDVIGVVAGSASPVDLWLQVSTDGGTSWVEGASEYDWVVGFDGPSGGFNAADQDDSKILLNYPGDNERLVDQPEHAYNSRILVQNPGGGNGYFSLSLTASYFRNVGTSHHTVISGVRKSSERVDALRLRTSSGNIQGGTFKVYGLR